MRDLRIRSREEREQESGRSLVDRIRARSSRRRAYWQWVVLLAAIAAAVGLVFPVRARGPVVPQPALPRPSYRVLETRAIPGERYDRLSLKLLVNHDMSRESLRAVLDWAVFAALDESNRARSGNVRTVWAYAMGDSLAKASHWRAMAIWYDPNLPKSRRPSGIGGDALKQASLEYDFTNPVLTGREGRVPGKELPQ